MKKVAPGTWIENPLMGQRYLIVRVPAESGGRSYQVEYFNHPFTGKGAQLLHFHRTYTERFEILSGRARYRLGDQEYAAQAGETVILPPGIFHLHPWSDSANELHVRQTVDAEPADLIGLNACLNSGITFYGLARDGKVDRKGMPTILQLAVTARSTMPVTYSAGMPIPVQRVIIGFLAVLGTLAGYRATYPEYGEV